MARSRLPMSRNALLGSLAAVVVVLAMSLFTVDETQTAIRFQLGEIVEANADEFRRAIAFEDVSTGGSIIVFGPERDMLEVARNFLEFFVEESCGQCTPCRDGNPKLLEGVELLEKGRCSMRYLRELTDLGETMQVASKCGLGQSSPNAFLSIVKHFRNELMGRCAPVAN